MKHFEKLVVPRLQCILRSKGDHCSKMCDDKLKRYQHSLFVFSFLSRCSFSCVWGMSCFTACCMYCTISRSHKVSFCGQLLLHTSLFLFISTSLSLPLSFYPPGVFISRIVFSFPHRRPLFHDNHVDMLLFHLKPLAILLLLCGVT